MDFFFSARSQAKDLDANSLLQYSIIAGNDDELFRIDSRSGTISTLQVLDFEKKQAYDLLVQVSDGFNVSTSPESRSRSSVFEGTTCGSSLKSLRAFSL